MSFRKLSVLAAALLYVAACNRTEPVELDPLPSPSADSQVSLTVQGIAQVDDMIADYRGKVVVVDLWAMW